MATLRLDTAKNSIYDRVDGQECVRIPLTKGQYAIVDADDYRWLKWWRWCVAANSGQRNYAVRRGRDYDGKKRLIWMHRMIMDAPADLVVDHVNGNGLDNRKCNLRLCTQADNCRNRSRRKGNGTVQSMYRGVTLCSRTKEAWVAAISVSGRGVHLGRYRTQESAAKAYDSAATLLGYTTARLHFPNDVIRARSLSEIVARSDYASTRKSRTTGYFGVYKRDKRFEALIYFKEDGTSNRKSLGRFNTATEAALAYDVAARAVGKPATRLNFPNLKVTIKEPQLWLR